MTEHKTPSPDSPPPRQLRQVPRRWPIVVAVLMLFASGGVLGGVGGALVIHRQVVHAIDNPNIISDRIHKRIRGELGLSNEQGKKITGILKNHHKQMKEYRTQKMKSINQEIAKLLTDDQFERWQIHLESINNNKFGFPKFERHNHPRRPHRSNGPHGKTSPVEKGDFFPPINYLQNNFQVADRNKDARLSIKEFIAIQSAHGPLPKRLFSRLDIDKDAHITQVEIEIYVDSRRHKPKR